MTNRDGAPLVSPGGPGGSDTFVRQGGRSLASGRQVSSAGAGQVTFMKSGPSKGSPRFDRKLITSGERQVFRGIGGNTYHVEMILIGWRVFIQDQFFIAEVLPPLAAAVTEAAGGLVRFDAMRDVPKDTHATEKSMAADPFMQRASDDFIANMGPNTFYAPFLEFGTVKMSPRPFLIPAWDAHRIDFINGLLDMVRFALSERPSLISAASRNERVLGMMRQVRGRLYSIEKALGDISVLGGRSVISPVRGNMLRLARGLGDIQAGMTGGIRGRVTRRITGRATGRLTGLSRTAVFNANVTGEFSGGMRVYNRVVGRATSPIVIGSGGLTARP